MTNPQDPSTALLLDGFDRVREVVTAAVSGLTERQLTTRLSGRANSIAWLAWHLSRIQDDHVAELAGRRQVWTEDGWADRFALRFDPDETGYGQSSEEVGEVRGVSADLLLAYYDAVHQRTLHYVSELSGADLDRVVDDTWDPPVTVGVRLLSVLSDDLQHGGQAAFIRGIVH